MQGREAQITVWHDDLFYLLVKNLRKLCCDLFLLAEGFQLSLHAVI